MIKHVRPVRTSSHKRPLFSPRYNSQKNESEEKHRIGQSFGAFRLWSGLRRRWGQTAWYDQQDLQASLFTWTAKHVRRDRPRAKSTRQWRRWRQKWGRRHQILRHTRQWAQHRGAVHWHNLRPRGHVVYTSTSLHFCVAQTDMVKSADELKPATAVTSEDRDQ